MSLARRCSRTTCDAPAVGTLTYVYSDQTAVVGPLATLAEPHAYDMCATHIERLSAPVGWSVVRLALEPADVGPSTDDLLALADAVREAAKPRTPVPDRAPPPAPPRQPNPSGPAPRTRHLRVLTPEDVH